jgi:hypothetical protein
VRITRGDLLYLPYVLPPSQGDGMGEQKSAEGIVGRFDKAEGPNMKVPEDGLLGSTMKEARQRWLRYLIPT